jgi:methionine synthase II (cobalamin-independent)
MKRSADRILVTHVGSIPRPPVLRDLLVRQDRGEPVDQRDLDRLAEQAVRHVVEQQLEAGVDVGNDGEQPRAGFSTYVARRMEGFGGESRRPLARDIAEHPDYRAMLDFRRRNSARVANAPQAVAEVRYTDLAEAERECDLFSRCADGAPRQFTERFMTAVSPGTAATILLNAHYDSHEQYIMALSRELRKEYELIHRRGFVLQLDCPDLAMERGRFFQDDSLDRFLQMVELHVDAEEALAVPELERWVAAGLRGVRLSPAGDAPGDWIRGPLMPPLWKRCRDLKVPMTILTDIGRMPDIAALAVASIYYVWKTYFQLQFRREQTLRERVTYMLWVMAHRSSDIPSTPGAGDHQPIATI